MVLLYWNKATLSLICSAKVFSPCPVLAAVYLTLSSAQQNKTIVRADLLLCEVLFLHYISRLDISRISCTIVAIIIQDGSGITPRTRGLQETSTCHPCVSFNWLSCTFWAILIPSLYSLVLKTKRKRKLLMMKAKRNQNQYKNPRLFSPGLMQQSNYFFSFYC